MPRRLALLATEEFTIVQGRMGTRTFDEARRAAAVHHLAELFDVNPVVADIRLKELFTTGGGAQQSF